MKSQFATAILVICEMNQMMNEIEEDEMSVMSDDSESYDSEDADNWGPYYWGELDDATVSRKTWDNVKYASFIAFRKLHFAGEVMTSFFGLNEDEHQWAIDRENEELFRDTHRVDEVKIVSIVSNVNLM